MDRGERRIVVEEAARLNRIGAQPLASFQANVCQIW